MRRSRPGLALLLGGVILLAVPAVTAADSGHATDPPQLQPNPRGFVTNCHDYIGPLRSAIAQGAGPAFGLPDRFSGSFNPGKHYGSVGEEQFLDAIGVDTSCNP